MSTDPRTRAAVEDLWAHTVADPEESFAALLEVGARRRTHGRWAMAAAAAVAVLAAWWGITTFGPGTGDDLGPSHAPSGTPKTSSGPCHTSYVECLGARTYRFALYRPVTWQIPRGYGVNSGSGANRRIVESYGLGSRSESGVTVLERVHAASLQSRSAPGVPATAAGFVHWLASRPFLDATTPHRTTIDGRSAWQVRVRLKAHVGLGPATCNGAAGERCYPITDQEISTGHDSPGIQSAITGIWGDLTSDYTAFDLSGGATTQDSGPTVVWSWAFGHDTAALARNHVLVDGLAWPAH